MSDIFSSYDCDAKRSMLKEAEQAYHDIITGAKAVVIERNGRKVTYNNANIRDLRLYIQDLQVSLTPTIVSGRNRKPFGMSF